MSGYDAYRETGSQSVPRMPRHWELKRLKHVITMSYGDALSAEVRIEGDVGVYGSNGRVGSHIEANTGAPVIVVGRKGSYGKLNFSDAPVFCIDTAYHVAQSACEADLRFMYYAMQRLGLDTLSQDTGVPGLSRDIAYQQHLALPPLHEQLAIASYLDAETARIEGLIESKGELLALLRGFEATAFFSALAASAAEGPGRRDEQLQWLPQLPAAWARCKVKHLVLTFDQGVSPQCESRVPDDGEWGVLKVGCVNSGRFDPMESKALPAEIAPVPEVTVEEGDLLVSRANTKDLVGRSAVADRSFPKLMLSDKLYRMKLDLARCRPEFVRRLMWIPAVRQLIEERATGASPSMLNIDRRTILELPLPLPPLHEQDEILAEAGSAGEATQQLVRHVVREIELLRELRSATITDAVLGRIDVRSHMKN